MSCCACLVKTFAWTLLLVAITYIGVKTWMAQKSYIFDADTLKAVTEEALEKSKGKGHEVTFALVEDVLRQRFPNHILPQSDTEWIFVNAGGWMGAMYVLHASLTEYILLFGTAIDTSGHSGRYWANISDTIVSGKFVQWPEGTTRAQTYVRGDTVYHGVGETAGIQWTAPFWAVEYGRGFIPSTLGFALADCVFSTTDYYIIYRTVRIYAIALIREFMKFNF